MWRLLQAARKKKKPTEDDKEDKQEATESLAAAEEIQVDAATAPVSSELDGASQLATWW